MPDSLVITGPPASGKSRVAMSRFHAVADSLLLVPSSTQAEHAAHQLSRAGFAVRPRQISTLAAFLETRAPAAPSNFLLHFAIEDSLERLRPPGYEQVAEYRGFREALARLAQEVPAEAVEGELASVFDQVELTLRRYGCALRHRRIEHASRNLGTLAPHIVLDGFFSFSRAEIGLIVALAAHTGVTVTLPDWPAAAAARREFLSRGFAEQICDGTYRRAAVGVFAATTLEREVEEIAGRVIEQTRLGCPFRDIGVILRVRDPYAPALETAFARFGIPARFYFADPLIRHPAIAFVASVVRALLGGWNDDDLLAIVENPMAGFDDRLDFDLREHRPGAGLPAALADRFGALDSPLVSWSLDRLAPRDWANRLKLLRGLLPAPRVGDEISRDQLRAWQSRAAALDAFDEAMAQVGELGNDAPKLADFWKRAETALAVETLRVPDRRANVVHVFDVYEARQWELPLMFVCGLTEGHFPQHIREDAILNESARRRAGLPTSLDLQEEEAWLFEMATTRASGKTILSYARFNQKGDDLVPSTFLPRSAEASAPPVHPRPSRAVAPSPPAPIADPALVGALAKTHSVLAPTSIETFLQCPFRFFAAKTLRLQARPKNPRERLDALLQGSILHRALAELAGTPLLGETIFDDVFDHECRRARVPFDYRTEAIRLEMRRNFDAFLRDDQLTLGWPSRTEQKFQFSLNPLLALRGRIDRLDLGPRGEALIVDYKYSAANRIRERTDADQADNQVQAGIYLMAAARQFGLKPAGMFYCGLRKGVAWDGWHIALPGLEHVGDTVSRDALEEMARAAGEKAAEVFDAIASGRIAAQPADEKKCAWCDFRDICRVESLGEKKAATA